MRIRHHRGRVVFSALLCLGAPLAGSCAAPPAPPVKGDTAVRTGAPVPLVPIAWLEPAPESAAAAAPESRLPLLRLLDPADPRRAQCETWIDNEPARFMRGLIAYAWDTYGRPATWADGGFPILLRKGGNNAAMGFRLLTKAGIEEHADVPYIVLEADPDRLADTLLHEGGHLLHQIATRGHRASAPWSAILHTTFAVTDPLTAVSEGYAIHLETLNGHYGQDPRRRAFYHRLAPDFEGRGTRRAEFFAPVADLMTFSQSWARYQAVRDALPVFAGHTYPGEYLRTAFDPARDRATLKTSNAMIASEGAVASVLFWTAAGLADGQGATPGAGLEQPAVVSAERTLLAALAGLPAPRVAEFRPDVVDLVAAVGTPGSAARRLAVSRFVDLTRGVTARPAFRAEWHAFYLAGLALDFDRANAVFAGMEKARVALIDAGTADPGVLRAGLGPILPVRVAGVELTLKALGQTFPLEYDLNAASEGELAASPGIDAATRTRILRELERAPFASVEDFEHRAGRTLRALGLSSIDVRDER